MYKSSCKEKHIIFQLKHEMKAWNEDWTKKKQTYFIHTCHVLDTKSLKGKRADSKSAMSDRSSWNGITRRCNYRHLEGYSWYDKFNVSRWLAFVTIKRFMLKNKIINSSFEENDIVNFALFWSCAIWCLRHARLFQINRRFSDRYESTLISIPHENLRPHSKCSGVASQLKSICAPSLFP